MDLVEVHAGSSTLIESEVRDLERELRVLRRKANWHFVWTVLGLSPAALIPALGLLREGSFGLLFLLGVLVMVSQGYLGGKAARRAERVEKALENLRNQI